MAVDIRTNDRGRYMNELQAREKEIAAGLVKASQPGSPKGIQENDKRMRREIANSNERRRMQCINAGFSNLRSLIPQLEGEKLSKAAILQHTTEYITGVEKEKNHLALQVEQLTKLLAGQAGVKVEAYISSSPPPTKRKKRDTESSDEGVGSLSDGSDEGGTELRQENKRLQMQLETQLKLCEELKERNRQLEAQLMDVLNMQTRSLRDPNQVKLETLPSYEPGYSQVLEVATSHDHRTSSPHVAQYPILPPRPQSPTPERNMSMETTVEICDRPRSVPSPVKRVAPIMSPPPPVVQDCSIPPKPIPVNLQPGGTETRTPHLHNYCHRDHPRRRHRQQQKEQQQREEEERRQQAAVFRAKSSAANLEILSEAIRQIEGDGVLCQMAGERLMCEMYSRQPLPSSEDVERESEREAGSVSDMEELRSEGSGRDSPLHYSHHHGRHISTLQQQPSHKLASPQQTVGNQPSNFSDKYPMATHLLHQPVHQSFYNRPGVIVHKQ